MIGNFFGAEVGQTITTISDNFSKETTWITRDNFSRAPGGRLRSAEGCGWDVGGENWGLRESLRRWTLPRPVPQVSPLPRGVVLF